MSADEPTVDEGQPRGNCCPLYHEAVELVGRRWTGAILRVQYELSTMGHDLEPALAELQSWARRWLGARSPASV